jgi:Uri superfamily endonuclease
MDLPTDKGTYILIVQVSQMKRLAIGSLGQFDIIPGFYACVGSAFGSGGLRARIGHHLESTAEPHWHIDYLPQVGDQ